MIGAAGFPTSSGVAGSGIGGGAERWQAANRKNSKERILARCVRVICIFAQYRPNWRFQNCLISV
jgi:hypothetical protein